MYKASGAPITAAILSIILSSCSSPRTAEGSPQQVPEAAALLPAIEEG